MLSRCDSTAMVVLPCGTAAGSTTPVPPPAPGDALDPLELWDDSRNARITCAEARAHGIAPVPKGHPAYPFMRDGDGDGWVCE